MFCGCDNKFQRFKNKIWLSSPTMHGDELKYITLAYNTNWMSTVGENINEVESALSDLIGVKHAVALSCGTAALHLAVKLAGVKKGDRVFCSDMTFAATVNPVVYEGAVPVFIDSEPDTWNMDPAALEAAFEKYPDTKVAILAHLYGTPAKFDEIAAICKKHGAYLIEDAAESLGARYKGKQTGGLGDIGCISFNGNKMITGSSGGALVTNSIEDYERVKKWSTQSREAAQWYQHEETGYNYRMSNVVAGVVRGQLPYLSDHIEKKKHIYERYKEGLKGLPLYMNPFDSRESLPNFWLSCVIIDKAGMCSQIRESDKASFKPEHGRSCPTEILEALSTVNAEGRPIWKPMHAQPVFKNCDFITANGADLGMDIFDRGLCLPSDIKMLDSEQDVIIDVIRACFE